MANGECRMPHHWQQKISLLLKVGTMFQGLSAIKSRWREPSGYKDILNIAIPLIITTGSFSLQIFVDRLFLANYSSDAIAASVPAGLISFSLTSLFVGLASYVGTFVAQFYGARQFDDIGKITWQGFYAVLLSFIMVIPAWYFVPDLFRWIDHAPSLQQMEIDYAQILILSTPIFMLHGILVGFFTGQSKVAIVMWLSILITIANILLDYLLIEGNWGFPAMGIQGAALATATAMSIGVLFKLLFFFSAANRALYDTMQGWRWNPSLFKRLLKFGLPAGIQFQLESLAMTVFVLMVGRIGVMELTAHSIAMNIVMISIMPMAGISVAVSVLVAQRLGEGNPHLAKKATLSAVHLAMPAFIAFAALLFLIPNVFVQPFSGGMTVELRQSITPLMHDLLKGVALYCIFDVIFMLYSGALRGAGDTRFVAVIGIGFSWLVLVIPTVLLIEFADEKLRWSWLMLVLYMLCLCAACVWRFRRGSWLKAALVGS